MAGKRAATLRGLHRQSQQLSLRPFLAFTRPHCPSSSPPPSRYVHTSTKVALAAQINPSARTINAPFASIASSVARILPPSVPDDQLPLPRSLADSLIGRTLEQVRGATSAKSADEAKAAWALLDAQIRSGESMQGQVDGSLSLTLSHTFSELSDQQLDASALTALASLVISASSDPRRHSIAFNLYRIAFGTDPADLPAIEVSTSDFALKDPAVTQTSPTETTSGPGQSKWGDWQAAYHWAALVLQGRAPPPPGTFLLVPGEQRLAQASQSSAAFRVFAHLANQGHPRGIFGIGRHLLSTLERNVDPTALAAMPAGGTSAGQTLSRQETLAEVERLYQLAGQGGVEEAWFELGALYAEGKWVRKDDAKARSFLEEGAERDSPRACQALASLLTREAQATKTPASLDLAGETQDEQTKAKSADQLRRALELLKRGGELGSAECAFAAGMRYLLRPSAPDDTPSGNSSLSTSLDTSLDPSQPTEDPLTTARKDHVSHWGVDPDDDSASTWFATAVQGGNTLAMMNLARMHLEGRASTTKAATRRVQLSEASDLYAKILTKAMGPEGQKAKAMAEVQAKIAQAKGQSQPQQQAEPGMSAGSGRLDDLGIRAEEGMRLIREELATLPEERSA